MPTSANIVLRLMGDNFEPNFLTSELSIKPSKKWKKGEESKKFNTSKTYNCWMYETGYKQTDDINDLLKIIYSIFNKKRNKIKEITEKLKLDIALDIIIKMTEGDTPALYFEKNIIDFVHYLGAEIDIDLYIAQD